MSALKAGQQGENGVQKAQIAPRSGGQMVQPVCVTTLTTEMCAVPHHFLVIQTVLNNAIIL
jgi:hypothetical protein